MKRFTSIALVGALVAAGLTFALAGGAVAAKRAGKSPLPKLTLALNGTSVKVGGATVSGAVEVVTTVTKEKAGEPILFHLNPGVGLPQVQKCFAAVAKHHGDLNYTDACGKILFDAAAPQGKSSAQTLLPAGKYLALDVAPKRSPHALFAVKKSAHPAKLPKPGATIASIEFAFRGADTLKHGELVRFVNEGFLVHMDVWVRVKNTADAQKVIALLKAGNNKGARKYLIGQGTFAGPLSTGGLQQLVVNEAPGVYVQACFMETQDGRDHTQLGMERMFKIVK